MDTDSTPTAGQPRDIGGETPTLRVFSLLELIAAKDEFVTLQGLAVESGLPKPTLHRMLRQLEDAGLLVRQVDGRHYGTGARLRELAEDILLNAAQYGATHGVLRHLAESTGESCNLTALSGDEVIYLDRVETTAPLRFTLAVGSRAPVHASASGKVLLAQMTPTQRRKLLSHSPLPALTPATLTDPDDLERSLEAARTQGWAIDDEEFLPGLVCIAVPIPSDRGRSNRCLAIQAPAMRLPAAEAPKLVEPLMAAAASIATIESEGSTDTDTRETQEVS
ncbi:IclR family transcriptional regulator [Janibacter sp. GS2]|uniref:IclR family transcriptional regulator n=1 Tax=Janibacter sp. GS2 TaxID=3442646 RepID=UPI003EBF1832